MKKSKGKLLIVSGPSGVGKGTMCRELATRREDVFLSISATCRDPRAGEIHGEHYYFITAEKFQNMIGNGDFLEYAHYVSSSYGTPKAPVLNHIENGNNIILEIEVQGGLQVKEIMPEAIMVFVLPPNMHTLKDRLSGRGTETEEQINKRLNRALEELSLINKYEYFIVNDDLEGAVEALDSIINE